tara:strand:+ start:31 stop:714 length:684 start_codon:yes stop_codon:yes gene_type:complete
MNIPQLPYDMLHSIMKIKETNESIEKETNYNKNRFNFVIKELNRINDAIIYDNHDVVFHTRNKYWTDMEDGFSNIFDYPDGVDVDVTYVEDYNDLVGELFMIFRDTKGYFKELFKGEERCLTTKLLWGDDNKEFEEFNGFKLPKYNNEIDSNRENAIYFKERMKKKELDDLDYMFNFKCYKEWYQRTIQGTTLDFLQLFEDSDDEENYYLNKEDSSDSSDEEESDED